MKKSELVVKFLRHWNPLLAPVSAETEVLLCFTAEYPVTNYASWNTEIDDDWSERFFRLHKDDPDIDLLWLVSGLSSVGPQHDNPFPSSRGGAHGNK